MAQVAADSAEERINDFRTMQSMDYAFKVRHAEERAWAFYEDGRIGGNCCVSVGGLDSLTLLIFLRHIGIDVPAVSVSTLEDRSIQAVHQEYGVEVIAPYKSKLQVIQEFGFPVISKEKARKISILQSVDSEKQTFIHAVMTGDMGEQGHFRHSDKIKLPDKWLELFAGNYGAHRPDLRCRAADFKVSSDCCHWMKEKPMQDWQKEHGLFPYLGLMASEGGQRELGLVKNGCNYFGKSTVRSCPFAIFSRQDILQLAQELDVHVPKIYGEIVQGPDGLLRTTRAQRTGCSMCGFGIHIEKRPHRFDRLREDNPKEWAFWMYDVGWGHVLDYIGVGWEDDPYGNMEGQSCLWGSG